VSLKKQIEDKKCDENEFFFPQYSITHGYIIIYIQDNFKLLTLIPWKIRAAEIAYIT